MGENCATVNVPREPTEAMCKAAAFSLLPSYAGQVNHQMGYDILSKKDIEVIWKAMLAAYEKQGGIVRVKS